MIVSVHLGSWQADWLRTSDTARTMSDALPPAAGQPMQPGTLADALKTGEQVFRAALEQAQTLPKLSESFRAPSTLAEATAAVQQREEQKKKAEALKTSTKSKSKHVPPGDHPAAAAGPGSQIGNPADASSFWMFVEVRAAGRRRMGPPGTSRHCLMILRHTRRVQCSCINRGCMPVAGGTQDYFRNATQEDLLALMPVAMTPEEDEALSVPFLGRDMRGLDVKLPASKPGSSKQAAATPRDAVDADDSLLDVRHA